MSTKNFWLWIPPLAWMGLIFFLSSQTGPAGPEWRSVVAHIGEYSILSALFWPAFRGAAPAAPGGPTVWAISLATVYGLTDEFHQSFVPGRVPDPADLAVDFLAATAAALLLNFAAARYYSSRSES